jgi:hypothetical protein
MQQVTRRERITAGAVFAERELRRSGRKRYPERPSSRAPAVSDVKIQKLLRLSFLAVNQRKIREVFIELFFRES